jgi:hypothetical protein
MSAIKQHLVNVLPDWFIVIARHRRIHGAFPKLFRPETFNEKIVYRILFDRRPLWTQLADKAAVRTYIQSRLGSQILPRLHHLTTRPATIPFDQLPEKFVVKPTHASGLVQIVMDKQSLNRIALIDICTKWLSESLYRVTREWPYKHIEPQILIEEFIDDGGGTPPKDYKLFVFDGKVELIQIDIGRFTHHRRRLYTVDWQTLDVRYEYENITTEVPRPTHLDDMIAAARTLGSDLDFVRADFYDTRDRLYLGELTTTPEAGMGRFSPVDFDHLLGSRWRLPHTSRSDLVRSIIGRRD